jgi:isoleucyl-tRNA synthetase
MASISFPKEEERILAFWKEIGAFERQVELSKGREPYTFYDGTNRNNQSFSETIMLMPFSESGPPFATGLPHYGHLLASTIKDVVPRYWSMNGRYVERRFGW